MQALMRLLIFLAISAAVACSQNREPVSIVFGASLGEVAADCGSLSDPSMTDLRFFVYDLSTHLANGEEIPIEVEDKDRWQGDGIALIDLEDASGACLNGTPGTNNRVTGSLPPGEYEGLRFVVGVPFERNHADPLLARPPLDDSSMHWHWRSGYKFFRAGLNAGERTATVHIGSAGCNGTTQNISGCDFPNRFEVRLDDWRPGDIIRVDLAEILRHVPPGPDDYSCLSAPLDEACVPVFSAFGIDPGDGSQAQEQKVFSLQ